jgi:hypothetical protein
VFEFEHIAVADIGLLYILLNILGEIILHFGKFKVVRRLIETALNPLVEMLAAHTPYGINILHLHIEKPQAGKDHHCAYYPNS